MDYRKNKKLIVSIIILAILAIILFLCRETIFSPKNVMQNKLSAAEQMEAQILLKEAITKTFEINSVAETNTQLEFQMQDFQNQFNDAVNAVINLNIVGSGTELQEFLPNLDYTINLDFQGSVLTEAEDSPAEDLVIQAELAFRILERILYGKFKILDLKGKPELEQFIKAMAEIYSDQWYSLSYADLIQFDPSLKESEEQHTEVLAEIKKLLTENDVFLVINQEKDQDQTILTVKLNWEIIFEREFLNEVLAFILNNLKIFPLDSPQYANLQNILTDITDEELAQAKLVATEIEAKIKPIIQLTINPETKFIEASFVEIVLDLAQLDFSELELAEQPQDLNGKFNLKIDSSSQGIEEAVEILAPAEAIDLNQPEPKIEEQLRANGLTESEIETLQDLENLNQLNETMESVTPED